MFSKLISFFKKQSLSDKKDPYTYTIKQNGYGEFKVYKIYRNDFSFDITDRLAFQPKDLKSCFELIARYKDHLAKSEFKVVGNM